MSWSLLGVESCAHPWQQGMERNILAQFQAFKPFSKFFLAPFYAIRMLPRGFRAVTFFSLHSEPQSMLTSACPDHQR